MLTAWVKPHFSAAFSRTGRKGPYACYYVHLEPAACFIGGGLWHPDSAALAKLRASIDERPARWRRVLNEGGFKRTFLGLGAASSSGSGSKKGKGRKGKVEKDDEEGVEKGEEAALKAFAERNKEGALKTRPKGFIPEHRDMQLLKLRNFTVGKKVADVVFTNEGGQEEVAGVVRDMVGFVSPPIPFEGACVCGQVGMLTC
jgi:uncharacterized protein (TIGR02453 family)